jgi:CDP-diacylglycerol--glycerol-3-phosphate 3-phosphatidyltransferase
MTKADHGIVPAAAASGARQALAPLVRVLAAAGLSPNDVTIGGALLSLAGAMALVGLGPLPGLALLLLGAAADALDGQLARETGRISTYGGFLDSTLDRLSDAAPLLAAVLLATARGDVVLAAVALVALTAGFLVSYTRAKAESLGLDARVGLAPREARTMLLLLGVALWWVTGALAAFTLTITISGLLAGITVVQRIAHVSRQGDRNT